MIKHTLASLALLGGLGGLGGVARAGAFLLNEFDAKAVGRGNATAATTYDPSSIYYNVGGLAGGEGTQVMVGGSLISASASFMDLSGNKSHVDNDPEAIVGVFASSRLGELVAVGIGFYTPFGLSVNWPDDAPQNNIAKNVSLRTFFITPAVGLDLGRYVPGLTIGGGFDLVPASVELRQQIYFGTDRGSTHLGGTAFGAGGRVGVMYRPPAVPQLSLGAAWHSNVTEHFSGNGDFDAPPPYRASLPPDGDIRTSITLPQQFTGAVAVRPIPQLEIEGDVIWTNWSQFKELDIDVPASMDNGVMTITQAEGYEDKVSVRAGLEYRFPDYHTAFRVGYIWDPTPIPRRFLTAQLPDINRNDVTVGGSYSFGRYDVHLGLLWVVPGSRTTADTPYMPPYKGTFDVSAFVATLTLAGHFGP